MSNISYAASSLLFHRNIVSYSSIHFKQILNKEENIKLLWQKLLSALSGGRQSSTIILFGMTVSLFLLCKSQEYCLFTLNNYLIKRRKENCGGNCRRPYRAADNLPWNDGFIISSIQINKAYNIHFS